MSEHSHTGPFYTDRAYQILFVCILSVLIIDAPNVIPFTERALMSLWHTGPFLIFALLITAYLQASKSEVLLAKAFKGNPVKMVFASALLGGLHHFVLVR